jgi:hypothetical protein
LNHRRPNYAAHEKRRAKRKRAAGQLRRDLENVIARVAGLKTKFVFDAVLLVAMLTSSSVLAKAMSSMIPAGGGIGLVEKTAADVIINEAHLHFPPSVGSQ